MTPVQIVLGSDPVPQGAFVALAPEQPQPLIPEDGQLATPSLNEHKALASDCCWLIGVGDIVGEKDDVGEGAFVG